VHIPLATRRRLGDKTGVSWVPVCIRVGCVYFMAFVIYGPLAIAGGPAAIGTSCDDLHGQFNSVRLSDLRPEVDAKLCILKRALGNTNHGEGKHCCAVGALWR